MADRQGATVGRPALVLVHPMQPADSAALDRPEPAVTGPAVADRTESVPPLVPPAGVTLLPGERVLTLAVTLPPMAGSLRNRAAAFAIEDQIAQPLERAHVVLGPELPTAPGRWLVAVLERGILAQAPGPSGHRLIADYMILPVPLAGWMVWCDGKRLLARLPDGTGFATPAAQSASLWAAAGRPALQLAGGILPPDLRPMLDPEPQDLMARGQSRPLDPGPWLKRFDLRSGRHEGQIARLPRGVRALLVILGLGLLAHGLLAAADLYRLQQKANAVETAVRDILSAEGLPSDLTLESALARALASRQPAPTGEFLPMAAKAFSAMASLPGAVSLRDLAYDDSSQRLRFTIAAADLQSLQDAQTALAGAGLTVSAGAATSGNGGAEAAFDVLAAPVNGGG